MDADAVRRVAADLPDEPGVYRFLDGERTLYVGKAVSLSDRVRSYADPRSERIARMVERAGDVDTAVTDTETQALLLEANLIKRFQPRYNVRLTDDKSYPMVQLTDHDAPRIEVTRSPDETARVFGPFTDVGRVETVVKALRDTFGVRGCSEHKYRNRDRPCLDYDMGLCSAPCTGEIDAAAYREDVDSVRRFLAGDTAVLADPLREGMERAAEGAAFERAATLRDRLEAVERFHEGTADRDGGVEDVLGVAIEGDTATVVRLRSERGGLVDRDRRRVEVPDGADVGAVLGAFVVQFYAERDLPDSLLLPEPLDGEVEAWLEEEGVAVAVPGAGRGAELVDLALRNAHRGITAGDDLDALGAALDLPRPERIEGMDVSHAGGSAAVGSDVVFLDGAPEKGDYRRKKLPERNDDYANMRALVAWRARRAREGRDERPDPDLLLVDGGRGQLEAATRALKEQGWEVPVVALAKEEEVVHTADRRYDWEDSPRLHVLQRVRDEAHRFAVQYHRGLRDEVATALDDVEGIGPELRRRLLRRFGSVEGIRAASDEELRAVDGVGEKTVAALRAL